MLYSSRKSAVIRYILTGIICAVSAIISDDKNFSLFMLVLTCSFLALLFIIYLFWKGFDNGSFTAFYSQDNLKRRDKYIRYFSIFSNYGVLITVILHAKEDLVGIILSAVILVLLIVESIFYFRTNNNLSD